MKWRKKIIVFILFDLKYFFKTLHENGRHLATYGYDFFFCLTRILGQDQTSPEISVAQDVKFYTILTLARFVNLDLFGHSWLFIFLLQRKDMILV